jgi:hypothetical protein
MKQRQRREEQFKRQLDRLFQMISATVTAAAELGETKCLYDTSRWAQEEQQQQQMRLQQDHQKEMLQLTVLGRTVEISTKEQKFNVQMQTYQRRAKEYPQAAQAPPEPPSEELLAGLKEKFPDCSVSFQEDWVETRQCVRELKKGILVDWS